MPDKDKILSLHSQGLSIGQIAEKLKVDSDVVRSVIARQWADDKEGILMRSRVAGRHGR